MRKGLVPCEIDLSTSFLILIDRRAQWIWERTNDKIGCGYADILQNGSIRNVSRNQVPKRGAKLARQSKMAPGQLSGGKSVPGHTTQEGNDMDKNGG